MAVEMSREDFEALVDEAINVIPDEFWDQVDNLVVLVEDEPPASEPSDILGLYDGVPITERDDYAGVLPDRVFVFATQLLRSVTAWKRLLRKCVLPSSMKSAISLASMTSSSMTWGGLNLPSGANHSAAEVTEFGRVGAELLKVSYLLHRLAERDGGCSSVGRAPGCGPGRRGFESRHSRPEGKGLGCENIRGLCVASRAAAGFLAPKQMPPFNPVSASHTCPVRSRTVGAHPARFEHKVL